MTWTFLIPLVLGFTANAASAFTAAYAGAGASAVVRSPALSCGTSWASRSGRWAWCWP